MQAVGAISEAAPSRLSLKLQAEVRLAHMAFQAISACFSITTVGLASSAWSSAASWKHYPSTDLERLKATIVTFITSVARDAANLSANVSVSQTEVQSAAAELRGEQLLVLAGCCHTLCGQLQSTAQDAVLGWELAQLIEALLEGPPKSSLVGHTSALYRCFSSCNLG